MFWLSLCIGMVYYFIIMYKVIKSYNKNVREKKKNSPIISGNYYKNCYNLVFFFFKIFFICF